MVKGGNSDKLKAVYYLYITYVNSHEIIYDFFWVRLGALTSYAIMYIRKNVLTIQVGGSSPTPPFIQASFTPYRGFRMKTYFFYCMHHTIVKSADAPA